MMQYDTTEKLPLHEFTEKAYLDYSMYVILDRALPHLGDGLKPVQRRIVYAMSELGLSAAAKYKKSARTVGDVLGKFHPHGDSACYEAMVLMAQPFSYRYPLVDGQGNWGSPDDPKSFAAMRYTESRLAPYAKTLLQELGQGTSDWTPNFDGTLQEPKLLPARLPNVLLNGTTGIAVGMATDIPPHNLNEVVKACLYALDHEEADTATLCRFIKAPDYPTEAEIISAKDDLIKMYEKGNGTVRMRARWEKENGDIIVTALPYQVSGNKILDQIAKQMQAKKLPLVDDLRDESDHEYPTRLVIVPRSNRVDVEALMSHLFASTDLEKSYRVNLNMIGLNGRPQVKNLSTIIHEWLRFRRETVRRRLQWRLDKVEKRLHILDGLLAAFLNIDDVIHIIRYEDEPKAKLMERFKLSEIQAEAILELRLRHLAKLEEMRIRGEQDQLDTERKKLRDLLQSPEKLTALMRDELREDAKKYGNARRSPLNYGAEAAQVIDESAMLPAEPVTVVLSQMGWIRAAKGHEIDATSLNYKQGDAYQNALRARSNQQVIILDTQGRAYSLMANTLPSARGQGEPLTGRFSVPAGARFLYALSVQNKQAYVLASSHGYGFIVQSENLVSRSKGGKTAITLNNGAEPMRPQLVHDFANDRLAVVSSAGYLLIIALNALPEMQRGKGNKLMNIPAKRLRAGEETVVALRLLAQGETLKVHAGKRYKVLKTSELEDYSGERGQRGKKLPRGYQNVSDLDVI